ncbi:MAG TPA: glutamate--cysteine ligase [Jiangellaceae bacterium]
MGVPFAPSQRRSVGLEWELQIVDRTTRELVSAADELLGELRQPDGQPHPKAKPELLQSQLELITDICDTVPEAVADLAGTVAEIRSVAEPRGMGVMCAGTHPFSHWNNQKITPDPRYEQLVDQLQWIARRFQIFGVHVHVGLSVRDHVIPVLNAVSRYLPHFLALTASSPYWVGHDTGLASARVKVFEGLPRAGLPYQFDDWRAFEDLMGTLLAAGAITTVREVWWDVRPHPDFGTIELRICDGLPTLEEIAATAALFQCLVEQFDQMCARGERPQAPATWMLRENKWLATRYGLDAEFIEDESGRTVPVKTALRDLVGEITPIAHTLGCADELRAVDHILSVGASYQRQRAVAAASGGDLTKVVDSLLEEMASGIQ